MHQNLIQRFENSCLMVMDHQEDGFAFLGSAFIIHSGGYLLTAAHILDGAQRLVLVTPAQPGVFTPLVVESSQTFTAKVVQSDPAHNMALLKLDEAIDLGGPSDIIGRPETVREGTPLLTFGVSFGHFRIHNVMVMQAMLSAKVVSQNESHLLVFDSPIHAGDIGGALVNADKSRIIGIMQGIFNPLLIQQLEQPEDYPIDTNLSYAVSIEYAEPLLRAEGLDESQLS